MSFREEFDYRGCSNCVYWFPVENFEGGRSGECRKHSPTISASGGYAFPKTPVGVYCGEWVFGGTRE